MSSDSKPLPILRSTAEFADYIGLSRSAVSRVINNQPGLRAKTIERVRQAIKETGFTPNAHALHLVGRPTATIGICIENFLTPTAVLKLSVLQERLHAADYTALIEVHHPSSRRRVVEHFLSMRVAAVVFIGHFEAIDLGLRLAELSRHGVPHVIVDDSGTTNSTIVTLDRVRAMEMVMQHLLDLGHRHFGLLGFSGPFQTVTDRLRGVANALQRAKLPAATALVSLDEKFTRHNHFDYGSTLARAFMELPKRPTAFLAINDETAVGAILEFQSKGLRIPRDLSVVGFNNQNVCLMTRPPLTSVDQEIEKMMQAVADLVLRKAKQSTPDLAIVRKIKPKFVLRGSTGPVRPAKNRAAKAPAR